MSKFKVGDKVRIKTFTIRPLEWNSEGKIDKYMGTIATISRITNDGRYEISEAKGENAGLEWWFEGSDFEEVPTREFIVIRRDKSDVIASHKRGDEIVKSAKATCAPSDEFNFETGAKLAFDRLMGQQNIEEAIKAWNKPSPAPEPKYYSGKVFAVRTLDIGSEYPERIARNGRVFEIRNGTFVENVAQYKMEKCGVPYKSFADFCDRVCLTEWAEVKE